MAHRLPTETEDPDFYPTPCWGGRTGAELIRRFDPAARTAWEPACGPGTMVHALRDYFGTVHASDAYLYDGNRIHDFLGESAAPFAADWIVTNPPFSHLEAFIERAWALARRGVAMLMPARVLEGVQRHGLLYGRAPLTVFSPFSERLPMHKGVYDPDRSTAAFYAWFFFLKPVLRPRRFMVRFPSPEGDDWRPGVLEIGPGTKRRLFRPSDLQFAAGGRAREVALRLRRNGDALGEGDLVLMEKVAREGGTRGVTAVHPAFPGGLLATLRMVGMLEYAPELKGDFGDRRFRLSADGRAVLHTLERL